MKTRRTLLPGLPETKKWVKRYGNALMCVRYRYDEARELKLTTVEIVVDASLWERNVRKIPGPRGVR